MRYLFSQSIWFSFWKFVIRTCYGVQFPQTCLNFHIHTHHLLDPRSYGLQSCFHCDVDYHGFLYAAQLTTQFLPCNVGFHDSNGLALLLGLHRGNLHV